MGASLAHPTLIPRMPDKRALEPLRDSGLTAGLTGEGPCPRPGIEKKIGLKPPREGDGVRAPSLSSSADRMPSAEARRETTGLLFGRRPAEPSRQPSATWMRGGCGPTARASSSTPSVR